MQLLTFANINLNDPFFDSLKADYTEFESWFNAKVQSGAHAFVEQDENGLLQAFLYLKTEHEKVADTQPALPDRKWVKVGTFKVNPHGTKLGERFVKKIVDYAIEKNADAVYLTVFPKHIALIDLIKRYGFIKAAEKTTANGTEDVMVKDLKYFNNNMLLDYPLLNLSEHRKYLLSVYPQFHTQLFPDSKLFNESYNSIEDVSHTNSIHKVYISFIADTALLQRGDLVLIYRTNDGEGPAYYRSVATSVCTVEEVKTRESFDSIDEYIRYCKAHSVFKEDELRGWYNRNGNLVIIKMIYNVALSKRLNRKTLIEEIGLNGGAYWGFLELNDAQFKDILTKGEVHESIIVN